MGGYFFSFEYLREKKRFIFLIRFFGEKLASLKWNWSRNNSIFHQYKPQTLCLLKNTFHNVKFSDLVPKLNIYLTKNRKMKHHHTIRLGKSFFGGMNEFMLVNCIHLQILWPDNLEGGFSNHCSNTAGYSIVEFLNHNFLRVSPINYRKKMSPYYLKSIRLFTLF